MENPLLNPDLLERALIYLDYKQLELTVACVCRVWRDVVADASGVQPLYRRAFWERFATQDENTLGEMEPAAPGLSKADSSGFNWKAECRWRYAAGLEGWDDAEPRKGTYVCNKGGLVDQVRHYVINTPIARSLT